MSKQFDEQGMYVEETAKKDIVNRPSHYCKYEIEPIDFIMRNNLPFSIGNAIKYLTRCSGDSPKIYDGLNENESRITDLKKAIRYCEMQINLLNGEDQL